jgi:hypothetical protein
MHSTLLKQPVLKLLSRTLYYGNFHPHQQQDCTNAKHHSVWQFLKFAFLKKSKYAFLAIQNHKECT